MTTFPSAPLSPCAAPATKPRQAPKVNRLLRTRKLNSIVRTQELNSLTFFSNPQNPLRTLPVYDVIHIPRSHFLSGVSIVTSLNDTSAPCAREHLRSCLHLTNPCAKRKVLNLTKPKGKIYKTKSLSHYITNILVKMFRCLYGIAYPVFEI